MRDITWCIEYLSKINSINSKINLPEHLQFRALMNITMPVDLSGEFYDRQDRAIKELYKEKSIISVEELSPVKDRIYLYKGDITTLKADAIVNACNEKLLGCFHPLHSCIDNAIHSFAGLEVRRELMAIMAKQGYDEPNGKCKVTAGYNLPAKYIFHTVGPKVIGHVTRENKDDLKSCYESCLKKAEEMRLESIVFPCISTGIYGYPQEEAAALAFDTVNRYIHTNHDTAVKRIVFNVFKEEDYAAYQRILAENDK